MKSFFRAGLLSAFILLSACANIVVDNSWKAFIKKDDFTDKTIKMVSIGDFSAGGFTYTSPLKLYPFVGISNGELYVGVRSGGSIRVPVGNIQLRIDDNEAWNISVSESPLESFGENEATINAIDSNIAKTLLPYTATGGENARKILAQMLKGNVLIYRSVTLTQPGSTGKVILDDTFKKALIEIGINPSSI